MSPQDNRVAQATGFGAQAMLVEVTELIDSMLVRELESSRMCSGDRVLLLKAFAGNLQNLAVELKLDPPAKLVRIAREGA